MGGGTKSSTPYTGPLKGLSPRGRGNPESHIAGQSPQRSIPAWAGEPPFAGYPRRRESVYPRVGGGTASCTASASALTGLSPRGRGNPKRRPGSRQRHGSIPAWAGEPAFLASFAFPFSVHPRVGGGTLDPLASMVLGGSIPAWAGEPRPSSRAPLHHPVYPRVGGGTPICRLSQASRVGLSPRGRGNRILHRVSLGLDRSIPAWAGEPPASTSETYPTTVYPRVGGGTLTADLLAGDQVGLSPRGRGNRIRCHR